MEASLVEDMEPSSRLLVVAEPEAAAGVGSTADESDSDVEFCMDDVHGLNSEESYSEWRPTLQPEEDAETLWEGSLAEVTSVRI